MKARDFCSVVSYNKFPNGTFVIINRPAYNVPQYPEEYGRLYYTNSILYFTIDLFS